MSVRPIDIKTNIMGNDEASRLREQQKMQEAGLAENIAQNKDAHDLKAETVQKTESAQGQILREEDEESEKNKNQSKDSEKGTKEEHEEDQKPKHPKISDGSRGLKIDLKA